MANINFDKIIPDIYAGLNVVSREMVGFIPAVLRDTGLERAAEGETIRVPLPEAGEPTAIVPGMSVPAGSDTTMDYVDMVINKAYTSSFHWNGKEEKGVKNGGQHGKCLSDQFADAFRKLANMVERDCALAAVEGASRATGTAGTRPFGTAGDLTDIANLAQILDDNGAPKSSRKLVLSSSAMANLRGKQSLLLKVNESGTDKFLRTGYTDPIEGFAIFNSAGLARHEKGAGTGYVTNLSAALSAGATSIGVDTGSGKIKAGDIVTFAGDDNKYVVGAELASAGNLLINKNGLQESLADGVAVTVGNNYTPSVGFTENALVLIARAPDLPDVGDSALDSTIVVDPVSGLPFEIRVYGGYREVRFEVGLAWGVKCIKPEHCALLLG